MELTIQQCYDYLFWGMLVALALCVVAVLIYILKAHLTVERLAAVCGLGEALRRFSCEIEHSQENLDRLLEGFWVIVIQRT